MKAKYIISVIALILILLPNMISATETFGAITCTEKFIPYHKFECRRADGFLEKVFFTESAMQSWYEPIKDLIPESKYIWTVGNMGI